MSSTGRIWKEFIVSLSGSIQSLLSLPLLVPASSRLVVLKSH